MKLYQLDAKLSFTEPDAPQPEASVPCDGCPAPCCTTPNWTVFLTYEEAKRLPYTFADVTFPGGQVVPFVAVLPRHTVTGACVFAVEGRCTVWALRPGACRAYDCRADRTPAMAAFAKDRFGARTRFGALIDVVDEVTLGDVLRGTKTFEPKSTIPIVGEEKFGALIDVRGQKPWASHGLGCSCEMCQIDDKRGGL